MHLQQQTINNPKETLVQFRNQLTYRVQLLTLVVLIPLTAWQAWQGNLYLALFLGAFAFFLAFSLYKGPDQSTQDYQAWGYIFFATGCLFYSTWISAQQGVYWAFPVLASYFFLLRPNAYKIAVVFFMLCFVPLTFLRFAPDEALRILISLNISALLVSYFATLVLRLHKDLVKLATCDPLTGCLNRSELESRLCEALTQFKEKKVPASLLLLDLDHFKEVNDQHGHHQGDAVLIGFAHILRQNLRPQDKLFRLGGEEFLVLFDQCTEEEAKNITERLLTCVRDAELGPQLRVTASAGLAAAQTDTENWSDWLHQADEVLYQAKNAGRDSYQVA